MIQIGNLTHNSGRALLDGAGDHGRCSGSYLTGIQVRKTTVDIKASISCDQIIANKIGHETRFASLELGMDDSRQAGDCDSGYSCAYTNNLAWRSETQPLPPILDPRVLFERLFGTGVVLEPRGDRPAGALPPQHPGLRHRATRKKLQTSLGPTDKRKLDEYLSSIREVERQLEKAEKDSVAVESRHGQAVRRAARLRRALQADERHDHDRVPGRHDARAHVPDDARGHQPLVPRDRHRRRPPSVHASPGQAGPDGEGHPDQRVPHEAAGRLARRS